MIEEDPWLEKPPIMPPLKWDKSKLVTPGTQRVAAGTPAFERARKALAAQGQETALAPARGAALKLGARNYLGARHAG